MRIVAGQYRGRQLFVPKDRSIRPTSDKVRGSIFNMLESRNAVRDAVILDGFCGTGALGLEALSRGAKACTFIDKSEVSLSLAKKNAAHLKVSQEQVTFIKHDFLKSLKKFQYEESIHLVLLDPPYYQNLCFDALEHLHDLGVLDKDALCVVELEKSFSGEMPSVFQTVQEKTYGDTKVLLLAYQV